VQSHQYLWKAWQRHRLAKFGAQGFT